MATGQKKDEHAAVNQPNQPSPSAPGTVPPPGHPPDVPPTETLAARGADAEAVRSRPGGNPELELIGGAIDDLHQRIVDRLGDNHKAGAATEFDSFRKRIESILGKAK